MSISKEKLLKAWEAVSSYLLSYLKQNVVKISIAKLIKLGLSIGGFKEWVISFILEHLYEDIGEPLVKLALRRVDYVIEYIDGQLIVKKIMKAKHEGNQDNYDHAMDDLLN